MVALSHYLSERREMPDIDRVLSGEIPVISKIRFLDGGIELRENGVGKTDLIAVHDGDLVVSGINALKGALGIYKSEQNKVIAATIHYSSYKFDSETSNPFFIQAYMRSQQFRSRACLQLPNGIKTELRAKRLLSVDVPNISLYEQHERLRYLRSRLEIVDSIISKRRTESDSILGRRVSIGADARRVLEVRLREMQMSLCQDYSLGVLGDILAEPLRHGPSFPCSADGEYTPVLMPSATTGFGVDTTRVLFSDSYCELSELDYLRSGDIIFARGNKPDQVGNCGVYEGDDGVLTYANLFMRIRLEQERYLPWFVQYWLMTPVARDHIRKMTKGTSPSVQKINGTGVRSIPFPREVSLSEQEGWVKHIDEIRILTSSLEHAKLRQYEEITSYTQAVFNEAFSGL